MTTTNTDTGSIIGTAASQVASAIWETLEPHLQATAYVNHLSPDDHPEKVRAAFGENYARLRQVKSAYDPSNLFRLNANVEPNTASADMGA